MTDALAQCAAVHGRRPEEEGGRWSLKDFSPACPSSHCADCTQPVDSGLVHNSKGILSAHGGEGPANPN